MIQTEFSAEEQKVLDVLKQVPDPEVEVNIVDLGLIYVVTKNDDAKTIEVDMTLSTPGCPVGDAIMQHVQTILEVNFPGYEVKVNLVWEPQWTSDLISEEGRAQLNQ
ncbi:MAG: metal-sulfur cluster assembly factor [Bacteroidetes bacterium]|nr:MAG: metal-sulfur cluster assembly factor [Bacteroidota bacterium]